MMIKITQKENSMLKGLQQFSRRLLAMQEIDALFLPVRLKESLSIMQSLVTDPARLADAVPLNPAFSINSARMVSRLSYKTSGRKTAVVLRPCEMRAFIELIKLKQGSRQDLILISMDCPGALTSKDFTAYMKKEPLDDDAFIDAVFSKKVDNLNGFPFSTACQTCEHPFSVGADISILLHGLDLSNGLIAESGSEKGLKIIEGMGMPEAIGSGSRSEVVQQIKQAHSTANAAMIEDIGAETGSIGDLNHFFDQCINCYNCRNMCPVCYCKECVFNTDVFHHQPVQYHQWSEKRGLIKMPTDTVFYHLTRMVHMSHACVGCGQCSNACPSGISVFELFKSVAQNTQTVFEYLPGRDENEPPPLSVFYEKEFEDVVGIK